MRHLWLIATLAVAVAAGTGAGTSDASAAGDPVWVVSQQGAELARIEAGKVAGRIPLGPAPVAAATDRAGRLYLTHPDGRAVTVVAPGAPPRRLPVPGQAFGLAASPDGAHLYVGDWSGGRVLKISAATGAVEGRTTH